MHKVALVVLMLGACSNDASRSSAAPPRPAAGTERGDCIPSGSGAVGTCDPGLLCLSNLCVRPPPADCQAIADQLASFDLGNYAELEQRAPVVAAYKSACEKALVSKEQGECIAKARDKFSASRCAPLMFPELAIDLANARAECSAAIEVERRIMTTATGGSADPSMARMLDALMTALRESCEQDGWPPALIACVKAATDANALTACNAQISPELQRKLTERMANTATQLQPPAR